MRIAAFLTLLVATAAITLPATDAHACGGLFCDGGGAQAVNQSAERIIFTDNGDGTITTVVQIMYEGPTDQFGWLLPVPGVPEVGISSDSVFQTLQARTNPTYQLNRTVEGECEDSVNRQNTANNAFAGANNATNNDGDNDGGGVDVLASGRTGPYDWVVIQVDSEVPDNTQLALDWLEENNYQVTNTGPELIQPYLDDGMNLLAVRLQKNQAEGAVRPMMLTYDSELPMIPIKLTAVAANSDMGVLVWTLGESRGVPKNYKALEINDALINWFNPGPSYNDVINIAADEAGGQGFVTEHATEASFANEFFWNQNDEIFWEDLSTRETIDSPSQYLHEMADYYSVREGFDDALNALNAGIDTEAYRERRDLPANFDDTVTGEMIATAIEDFVVAPLRDTQQLFYDSRYMTRLYTTLSPEEMTVDPVFHFNADLGDVSFQNQADHITECSPAVTRAEAPFRVELPSGLVVRGNDQGVWPFTPGDDMPANIAVREVGTSGEGEIVTDNVETIRQQLDAHNATVETPGRKAMGGSSCSSTGSGAPASLLVVLGFVGFAAGRRRRAR